MVGVPPKYPSRIYASLAVRQAITRAGYPATPAKLRAIGKELDEVVVTIALKVKGWDVEYCAITIA